MESLWTAIIYWSILWPSRDFAFRSQTGSNPCGYGHTSNRLNHWAHAWQCCYSQTHSCSWLQTSHWEPLCHVLWLLCCLSLGVRLTPISLSLPYSRLIILFLPWITLWFRLSRTPWSPCDPYASPLPHVLLSSLLLISSIPYSSYPVYITNPFPYALLIQVLLILLCLPIYPLPWLLLISNPYL